MPVEDFEVNGLVLREVKIGETDKLLTLLTGEHGKLTVTAKGAANPRSRIFASAQIFTYSSFLLRKRGNFNYVRETGFLESFEGIRYDIVKLALANYICDVANDLAQEGMEDEDFLSLVLNTLYALSKRELPLALVRGAFEFRAAVQVGFMPELSGCGLCGREPEGDCTLDVMNGQLLCRKCRALPDREPAPDGDRSMAQILIRLSPTVLAALRYIAASTPKKFLSFTMDSQELSLFSVVCERYLLNHVEHGYSSLEYYRKVAP